MIQAVRNKLQIEQIGVKYILVGNKIDLEDDRYEAAADEGSMGL